MFEGKVPHASDSRNCDTGEKPENALCELQWSDLVARLTAARELRAELAANDTRTLASFDADSARHLASQNECQLHDDEQRDVNPDDLGNGKGHAAKQQSHADRDTLAPRGNT